MRNVNAPIRRVRPAGEAGIDPCEGHRERYQTRDAEGRRKQCRVASQSEPKRETPGDLEDCGGDKGEKIGGHDSTRADRNSPVPGGPVRSSHTGPPSGSTVIWKRKNRQHWRSASTALAIVTRTSDSAGKRRRRPSACCSWSAARRHRSANSPSRRAFSAAGPNVQAIGRSGIRTSPSRNSTRVYGCHFTGVDDTCQSGRSFRPASGA